MAQSALCSMEGLLRFAKAVDLTAFCVLSTEQLSPQVALLGPLIP